MNIQIYFNLQKVSAFVKGSDHSEIPDLLIFVGALCSAAHFVHIE